jgi:catechol 2,3-dioxygenase-like lactoylglutathione lyase family enzyme
MTAQLTHLFMEVRSLERARWFWLDAIGLELLEDRGPYIRVGGHGGFAMGIEQQPHGDVSPEGPDICVRVSDVDALTTRLAALGLEVIEGPADMPWGWRHAWVHDPDGRRVTVYTIPDDHVPAALD